MKKLGLLLAVVMLLGACAPPAPEATPTPMPTSMPAPTNTPAPLAAPTPTPLEEITFVEPIRRQIFDELVDAQGGISGNEEARATVAQRWRISVDTAEEIISEGLEKGWLMPTVTPIPPTATPIPPTATPEVPEGWQVHESLDGSFTVAYPGSWEIFVEGLRGVFFVDVPGGRFLRMDLLESGSEKLMFGEDDEEKVRILVELMGFSDNPGFKVADKGVWQGSVYKGYFYEFTDRYKGTPGRTRLVMVVAGDDVLVTTYTRHGSQDFTAEDYRIIAAWLETIRVK